MKLTFILLTAALLQVSANTLSQTVTFSGKGVSLKKVFTTIEKQTGYVFFYDANLLDESKPVTLFLQDTPLEEALKATFDDQPLNWKIVSKTITIIKRPAVTTNAFQDLFPAPPVDITGRVLDENGKPKQGVTVTVKGTKNATATNALGEFQLKNVEPGAVLVISFVGYHQQEMKVEDGAVYSIKLKLDIAEMDAFTVSSINTGYQRIRPEQSTGAVSQISTKEYESRISTNFLDGLVNRMPGLMINNNVTFTSTVPGATGSTSRALFNIRGISTMSANQNPLIVIDGYPTELTIDMIDPNEIESVTILKDAAAATVYGVRASNGVIVITRKKATVGKPRFAFRATTGITPKEDYHRYRWADDASSVIANYQKTTQSTIVNANSWGLLSTSTSGTGGTVRRSPVYYLLAQQAANIITPAQAATSFAELTNYDNIDEYSNLFLRSAVTQTYNFNVSGGSGNATYYITANHTGNRQSRINNDNNRLLLSARSNLKLSQKLSLELTTDYQELRYNNAPVPAITDVNPYDHFRNVNGNPASILGSGIAPSYNNMMVAQGMDDHLYYPLVDANQVTDKTKTVNNRITANFKYLIGSGFDLSFGGIYETSNSDNRYLASEQSSVARQYVNSYVVRNTDGTFKYNIPKGGHLRQTGANTTGYTARAQLNYNKRIAGLHSVNAILGGEVRNLVNKSNTASYFGYNDETLLQQSVDYAAISSGTVIGTYRVGSGLQGQTAFENLFNQQYTEDRFVSGYTNLVYSYNNIYSLTGSVRIDQSNLFGTNPKYKFKPLWSVGAAWNIHKENFMQDLNWIRQLKLRAAYGFNGNVAKLSLPEVIARSVLNTYTNPTSPSLRLVSYANSSLRWEQTQNFNLGLDYALFKNISGSIDIYRKKSTDLLGNALIDPTIGVSPTLINQATINNKGIEFGLRADWIGTKKLNWNTGIVIARNTSKVLEVYQKGDFSPQTLNALGYVKNYPVGAMFSYRYAGLDSAGFPLIKNTKGTTFRTNVNSSGNATAALMASDTSGVSYYTGSSIPTINAGLSNRVDIGSFYIFAMVNYYGGFKVRVPRPNPASSRPLEGAGTYWKAKGDENTTDVMGIAGYSSANSNNAYNYADAYVVNGDYITLGDLTISYSLDQNRIVKKAGFSHFEVKAQASNIWTVGLNKYNYSMGTGSFQKSYLTPTFTFGIFSNF
jgi:TonB-linked SusC/RagA family outer membrane protein